MNVYIQCSIWNNEVWPDMRTPLTLHHLEAFVRVADTSSFSRASEILHVSQPALSRTIKSAEEVLRARLFDRDTRNVRLTAAGSELLPIARRVLSEFESSLGELAEFMSGRRGRIVVATIPSVGTSFLPAALCEFAKLHRGVEFSIKVSTTKPILDEVTAGEADFGICLQPLPDDRLRFEHLVDDEFVSLRSSGLKVPKGISGWALFREQPYIAQSTGTSIRMLTESMFRNLGMEIRPAFECESLLLSSKLVAGGLGVMAVPRLALNQMDLKGVTVSKLDQPRLVRQLGIVTRVGRTPSTASRAFLQMLKEHAKAAGTGSSRQGGDGT